MIFNVSSGKQNYSQRRAQLVFEQKGKYGTNIVNWKNTCNVHSLSMSLLYSGWIFPASDYKREPDSLGAYILHECLKENNFYKAKMPVLYNNWFEGSPTAYSPLELHVVLEYYINKYFGCSKADTFYTNYPRYKVFEHIYIDGVSVPVSVAWGGLDGHIISIVGFEYTNEKDLLKVIAGNPEVDFFKVITKIIIDDPYGKFNEETEKYIANESGNDVAISSKYFVNHWKNVKDENFKYAHIISKPVCTV